MFLDRGSDGKTIARESSVREITSPNRLNVPVTK
jgi:hypothetical protein